MLSPILALCVLPLGFLFPYFSPLPNRECGGGKGHAICPITGGWGGGRGPPADPPPPTPRPLLPLPTTSTPSQFQTWSQGERFTTGDNTEIHSLSNHFLSEQHIAFCDADSNKTVLYSASHHECPPLEDPNTA